MQTQEAQDHVSTQSAHHTIGTTAKAWHDLENALGILADSEPITGSTAAEFAQYDEAELALLKNQKQCLDVLLSLRSSSVEEVSLKLSVWQTSTFGAAISESRLSAEDRLILQAIRELASLAKG